MIQKLTSDLFIEALCEEGTEIKKLEFVNKNKHTKLKILDWHDPVDNPCITIYTQGGNNKPWRSTFGKVRTDISALYHRGLDLFGTTGTNTYACIDGAVYNHRWHGGYGNTIT